MNYYRDLLITRGAMGESPLPGVREYPSLHSHSVGGRPEHRIMSGTHITTVDIFASIAHKCIKA